VCQQNAIAANGDVGLVPRPQTGRNDVWNGSQDVRAHVYLAFRFMPALRPVKRAGSIILAPVRRTTYPKGDHGQMSLELLGGWMSERFYHACPLFVEAAPYLFRQVGCCFSASSGSSGVSSKGIVPHMGAQWWCLDPPNPVGDPSDPETRPDTDALFPPCLDFG